MYNLPLLITFLYTSYDPYIRNDKLVIFTSNVFMGTLYLFSPILLLLMPMNAPSIIFSKP